MTGFLCTLAAARSMTWPEVVFGLIVFSFLGFGIWLMAR
jgi:hypothetical protein